MSKIAVLVSLANLLSTGNKNAYSHW